jgi:hypothetical protein
MGDIRGRDRETGDGLSIEARDPALRTEPEASGPVQQEAPDLIIGQAILCCEPGERCSVVARYAASRGEPQIPPLILRHAPHRSAAQPLRRREIDERSSIVPAHAVGFRTEPEVPGSILEHPADVLADLFITLGEAHEPAPGSGADRFSGRHCSRSNQAVLGQDWLVLSVAGGDEQ